MKLGMKWVEGMALEAEADGLTVRMDAKPPIGKRSGLAPKELLLAGMGGCTGMDVIALLKKHKQAFETFHVEVDVDMTTGVHPSTFTKGVITYSVTGPVDAEILNHSVMLSQTQYCGVNAMLAKAFPISYVVHLNGQNIGSGEAHFNI